MKNMIMRNRMSHLHPAELTSNPPGTVYSKIASRLMSFYIFRDISCRQRKKAFVSPYAVE